MNNKIKKEPDKDIFKKINNEFIKLLKMFLFKAAKLNIKIIPSLFKKFNYQLHIGHLIMLANAKKAYIRTNNIFKQTVKK